MLGPLAPFERSVEMARRALKVFRTSIGFEDAYIAAPSRKAALDAWGSGKDLFALGLAEQVSDPEAGKAALDQPGVIIKIPRGTMAEHLSAVGKTKTSKGSNASNLDKAAVSTPTKRRRRPPLPSRGNLEQAKETLAHREQQFSHDIAELDEQIAKLQRQRRDLRQKRDSETGELQDQLEREEEAYAAALQKWEDWDEGGADPARS